MAHIMKAFGIGLALLVVFQLAEKTEGNRVARSPQFGGFSQANAQANSGSFGGGGYAPGFGHHRHGFGGPGFGRPGFGGPGFGRPGFGGPGFGNPGFGGQGYGRPGFGGPGFSNRGFDGSISISKSVSISGGRNGGGLSQASSNANSASGK